MFESALVKDATTLVVMILTSVGIGFVIGVVVTLSLGLL